VSHQRPGAIVRGERIANRSAKGGRSYARVRGLVQYIAYGRYGDHYGQDMKQRGIWLDHNGKAVIHDAVRQWAKDKVHRYDYEYSYQLLLSTRHGGLSEADFNHVLQRGSGVSQVLEWKYMVHEDTENQHAHAILFSREKLPNARYKEWQQMMQVELERLQAERQQERQLEQESILEQGAVKKVHDQGWEIEG
jgi:hypothetical protein